MVESVVLTFIWMCALEGIILRIVFQRSVFRSLVVWFTMLATLSYFFERVLGLGAVASFFFYLYSANVFVLVIVTIRRNEFIDFSLPWDEVANQDILTEAVRADQVVAGDNVIDLSVERNRRLSS